MATKLNKNTATYRDLDLRMSVNPVSGDISILNDVRAVIQSVRNIVTTSAGEFLWEPNIGAGISSLLFELNLPVTKMKMFDKITQNLTRFEPRIEIVDLSVVDIANGNGISITITFYMLNNPVAYVESISIKRVR